MNITAKMLGILLNEDFHVSMLMADESSRNAFSKVTVQEIDTLIANCMALKEVVNDAQEQRAQQAQELLERLIEESGTFSSVDELLSAMGHTGSVANVSSTPKGYKTFEVVLVDSKKDERRTYTVTNKVLTKSLKSDPIYQQLINKNPELKDVDELLRAYSEDYRKTYPINAKWDGKEFYLNLRGKMNSKSLKYFEEYKIKYPNGTEQEFKQVVQDNYKKV